MILIKTKIVEAIIFIIIDILKEKCYKVLHMDFFIGISLYYLLIAQIFFSSRWKALFYSSELFARRKKPKNVTKNFYANITCEHL